MFTWGSNAKSDADSSDTSFPDPAVPAGPPPAPPAPAPAPEFKAPETNLKISTQETSAPMPLAVDTNPIGPEPYTLKELLTSMVSTQATDLHLHVGSPPVFRRGGKMSAGSGPALTREMARTLLLPLLKPEHMERFKATGQHDFSYELAEKARFRGHYFGQHHGLAAVFHLVPWEVPSLDDLKLPDVLKNLCDLSSGLVLATGPARSGRSHTVAAMVDHINHNRCAHVIILEEPVEHYHESDTCLIDHREIGLQVNTLADGFRAVLHEQPDIVVMGEVKNREAAELALRAVESGMLVFATLGTPSVVTAIERFIDLFPTSHQKDARAQTAAALKSVIAHQLFMDSAQPAVALEVMTSNRAAARLIREGQFEGLREVMQKGKDDGMQTMEQAVAELMQQGRLAKS
ncbi:MAG TPA: ATPase, T2SS/T4P/T4SS family [Candidatus Xenobia bacterium]|jgi:twitching motility protein PilT